jgi:hypothetical protein
MLKRSSLDTQAALERRASQAFALTGGIYPHASSVRIESATQAHTPR